MKKLLGMIIILIFGIHASCYGFSINDYSESEQNRFKKEAGDCLQKMHDENGNLITSLPMLQDFKSCIEKSWIRKGHDSARIYFAQQEINNKMQNTQDVGTKNQLESIDKTLDWMQQPKYTASSIVFTGFKWFIFANVNVAVIGAVTLAIFAPPKSNNNSNDNGFNK